MCKDSDMKTVQQSFNYLNPPNVQFKIFLNKVTLFSVGILNIA